MKMCEGCYNPIFEYDNNNKIKTTSPHEIKSRGAGGLCIEANQFVLCVECHRLWHNNGWFWFVEKYDHLEPKAKAILGKPWHKNDDDDNETSADKPMVFI